MTVTVHWLLIPILLCVPCCSLVAEFVLAGWVGNRKLVSITAVESITLFVGGGVMRDLFSHNLWLASQNVLC